ncbi:MAG: NAD(P)-dependent oxidoreductase [Bacteroidia bacterium]
MKLARLKKYVNNILIADPLHEHLVDGLKKAGFSVLYMPDITPEKLVEEIKHIEGLVIRSKMFLSADVLQQAKNLVFIARAGAGMDNIDEVFATTKGIFCFNAGEANADAVGEHTVGMMLMLLNKLAIANIQVKNKIWLREENRGYELAGKTVGIIGFGNTGKAVAKKLSGFNVNVLAYDKYLKNYGNSYAKQASMSEIFTKAHILTLHVPLTSITQNMVNSAFINRFKQPFYLLNLSRGKVVDTKSLVKAMQQGKILGAALDVLENENLNQLTWQQQKHFNFLASSPKTVLSPHIGGWTYESYYKISNVLLNKILHMFEPDC